MRAENGHLLQVRQQEPEQHLHDKRVNVAPYEEPRDVEHDGN